jgi:dCTP deaminase
MQIEERLSAAGEFALYLDPLLERSQIGEVTVDLRLGYDFLVSILTRKPFIGIPRSDTGYRGLQSYFQATRRDIGDRFILYPGQLVLSTTLEYIGLPPDMYADLFTRSSYTRLGIHLSTMVQPGFRGCFPLELFNHGNNPVEIIVGSRLIQARFTKIDEPTHYMSARDQRKYIGDVRPIISKASNDTDIERLKRISEGS